MVRGIRIGGFATAILSFSSLVTAQQSVWGQCGGIGWSGATICASGSTCVEQNSYYFQCIPGAASSTSASASATTSATGPIGPTSIPSAANFWFSFGDSYTQTDFDPSSELPSVGNPLGNPPYPGYTAVGGTNWIDLLTVEFNNSLILTYNYAYGGATIDASLVAPYEPTVLSMTDQVNQFLSGAATKPASAPWTSANALFSFWIGINDIGNSYYQSGDRDAAVGGRNFLFINVPPVDRSPLMLAQSTDAQALEKSVIAGYNTKLSQRAAQLEGNYSDVQTWVWDSNAAFSLILDNPTAFGFLDATSYGGTGDFWGNNLHPSSPAHTIFAQNISTVLSGTVW